MVESSVVRTEAPSEIIAEIVGRIEDAVVGTRPGHCIIALLSLAILIQKPDISVEALQHVLRDTSNFLCLALDGVDAVEQSGAIEPNKLN